VSEKPNSRGQRRKELEKQKKSKQTPKKGLFKKIFLACLFVGLAGLLFGGVLFAYYASSAPELDEESLKDPISSEFYDINRELFATIGAENRDFVVYEDIPKLMENAILATEDVRFYDHMGIDFYRLGGAVLANITDGFGSQGASTLTQQVIKNSFLQNEKTLKRKAQEAYLAFQLEQKYEKEEIFEMYFNKVLMSGRVYGFGTASNYFYGRELKDLKLHEVALLAGIPQSPNNYNPFKNPESAEKRRNIVLRLMEQHGKITKDEMETAQAVPITEGLVAAEKLQSVSGTKYDAFLDVVLNEIESKGEGDSLSDGLKVYTTLDPQAQEAVESSLQSDNFPTESMQAGLTVLDTKSGAIAAIGGGRNFNGQDFNYAQDRSDRQIGSTAKPLVDYGPAIEFLDWSTGHTIVDEKMNYSDRDKTPIRNFDGKFLGKMTAREALYRSRNIPAVKTFREVNLDDRTDFAKGLSVPTEKLGNESSAIGGFSGINTIELAASYAAFGNAGIYTEPYSVKSIEYRDGKTNRTFEPKVTPAMKESTAYMVTDMLRDVVSDKRGASGRAASVSGLDIAGKTGTTNYTAKELDQYGLDSNFAPDVWFAGYTTNYSISVWTGYDKKTQGINTSDSDERTFAQRLFKSVMGEVSANKETANFKRPNSVVEATIEVGTSPLRLASEYTPEELKQTELFVRGTEPTQVSEKYEKLEVEAPTKLKADYSEGDLTATLSWEHKKPKREENDLPVVFEVSVSVDGGESTILQATDQNGLIVQGIVPGSSYTFTVVAIAEEIRSSPASVTLEIAAEEVPAEDDGNGDGNGNGNGNGNGDGNGNGNGDGNGDGGTEDDGIGDIIPPIDGGEEPPPVDGGDTPTSPTP
jgi:penicillin-binding protein 1A